MCIRDRLCRSGNKDFNGEPITATRHTDNTVILAENTESLQLRLNKLNTVDEEMGFSINSIKQNE